MDPWVLNTQNYLNARYGAVTGWIPLVADGRTGWGTVNGLMRALQHELDIPLQTTPSFGPATTGKLNAIGPIGPGNPTAGAPAIVNLIKGALYCKGYNGGNGEFSGNYDDRMLSSVKALRTDMGIGLGDGTVNTKIFKALLTMDPYKPTADGNPQLRAATQWLNGTYWERRSFSILPTNGVPSRTASKAVIWAVQYEGGLSDDAATGSFGPQTKAILATEGYLGLLTNDRPNWNRLLHCAMLISQALPKGAVTFESAFTFTTVELLKRIQSFHQLPLSGIADLSTWSALLVSYGDNTRLAQACDTRHPLSPTALLSLKRLGYELVGRYLTKYDSPTAYEKQLAPSELENILRTGLGLFPIFQTDGGKAEYFSYKTGTKHAQEATAAASSYGIPTDAIIYFGVDFDAYDNTITNNVIPYFKAIVKYFADHHAYRAGVYGSRNVCTRVSKESGAAASFVSDMSSGWSGNLGYPMPPNWTIDQFRNETIPLIDSSGSLEIDSNVWYTTDSVDHVGVKDAGVFSKTAQDGMNDSYFRALQDLQDIADDYHRQHPNSDDPNSLVSQFLRVLTKKYIGDTWDFVAGRTDSDFETHARKELSNRGTQPALLLSFWDYRTGMRVGTDHLSYTLHSLIEWSPNQGGTIRKQDIAGWAGDLLTVAAECYNADTPIPDSKLQEVVMGKIAGLVAHDTSFSLEDFVQDIDGYNIAYDLHTGVVPDCAEAFRTRYLTPTSAKTKTRVTDFYQRRFGSDKNIRDAIDMLFYENFDVYCVTARLALFHLIEKVPSTYLDPFSKAFANTLHHWQEMESI